MDWVLKPKLTQRDAGKWLVLLFPKSHPDAIGFVLG
jgi:hypothetical protein